MYVRGAAACIVVTDASNEKTLEKAISWKKVVEKHCQDEKIPYVHF